MISRLSLCFPSSSIKICATARMSRSHTHFCSVRDPVTGEQGWALEDDYGRDVARSAYADMLHDHDRNRKYDAAITAAVRSVKSSGRRAVVLDIGTGTSLLSMMASRAGADVIYACESFPPMATLAAAVLSRNDIKNVTLIPKRSTDLKVGVDLDLPTRANILITETFDTELIGEDCIRTYNHARAELMEEAGFLSVPHCATLFAQLLHSATLTKFHALEGKGAMLRCPGLPSAHDLQLSAFTPGPDFRLTSDPLPLFRYEFTQGIPKEREVRIPTPADADFTHVSFFWKLQMWEGEEEEGGVISTAPKYLFTHPEKDYAWREHWIQWVQFVPLQLRSNPSLLIRQTELDFELEEKGCGCGLHRALSSRSRIMLMNGLDTDLYSKLVGSGDFERVRFLGEDSHLPALLQKEHPHKAVVARGRGHLDLPLQPPPLESDTTTDTKTLILAEPSYSSAQTCVQNLSLYLAELRECPAHVPHYPRGGTLHCLAVTFHHLHKIRSRVTSTVGFDLVDFDDLILGWVEEVDPVIEAQALWEYDYDVLEETELFYLDRGGGDKEVRLPLPPTANGLVFYVTFDFGEWGGVSAWEGGSGSGKFKMGSSQAVVFLGEEGGKRRRKGSVLRVGWREGLVLDFEGGEEGTETKGGVVEGIVD